MAHYRMSAGCPVYYRSRGSSIIPPSCAMARARKTVAIEARFPDPDLSRVIGADGAVVNVPPGGIVLSERLASQLDVTIGDALDAEFLTGKRRGPCP